MDAPTDVPALPSLTPGIQLLDADGEDGRRALQSLVVDHVLGGDGPACWVDAGRTAVTSALREVAPDDRVLDRIAVARGFTPYQHTALLRTLDAAVRERDASLVVVPALDVPYRTGDARGETAERLLLAAVADLARLARTTGLAVLVTRRRDDDLGAPVAAAADRTIHYRRTAHGARFEGDDVETLCYPLGDGWVQTTLSFWQAVLAAREPVYDPATAVAG